MRTSPPAAARGGVKRHIGDFDTPRVRSSRPPRASSEAIGYSYRNGEWSPPAGASPSQQLVEADALHGMLMRRADALAGCTKGSDEEAELKAIVDAIEAYEARRWPLGKDPSAPGGKG